MIAHHLRRALFSATLIGGLCAGAAQAQDTPADLAAAAKEAGQAEADLAKKTGAEREAMIADKYFDIHGSGWLYNRQESAVLGKNLGALMGKPNFKIIHSDRSEEHIVPFSRDAVVISRMTTMYTEVPNPQDVARKAGTMLDDPAAIAHAAATRPAGPPPGEMSAPNPYRYRQTNVWLRINGHWQLALSTGVRVGEKVLVGVY